MNLDPVIAIHGVGNHRLGRVSERVRKAFDRASMRADISEFNWDQFAEHSVHRMRDAVTLLDHCSESISNAAALPLFPTGGAVEILLHRAGEWLYNSVFRFVVAAALTVIVGSPLIAIVVYVAFNSFSWDSFAWTGMAMRIGVWAVVLVLSVLVGLDLLRSLITRTSAPIWVTVRRSTLLVLQPLILLLTIPVSAQFGSRLVAFATKVLALAIVVLPLSVGLGLLAGQFNDTMASIGVSLVAAVVLAALGALHAALRHLWIGGPLKIVLDIVRYMGSPVYRTTLQRAFDDRIRQKLGTCETEGPGVVLFAHSLGSVIAVDSLVNSPVWKTSDSVVLVTVGSPIRRFFFRFFPAYLFPASADEISRIVASRLRRFLWINLYRRWDYVGGRLGLERVGADVCTGQRWKVVNSHSNYWDDDVIIDVLRRQLQPGAAVCSGKQTMSSATNLVPSVRAPRTFGEARFIGILPVTLTLVLTGFAAFNGVQSTLSRHRSLEQDLAMLKQSATRSLADVSYHRTMQPCGEDRCPVDHFVFRMPELGVRFPPVAISTFEMNEYPFVDFRGLAAFVLENCVRTEQKRWWQILRSTGSIPCTRTGIPIRYDAGDPAKFYLPTFPARTTLVDVLGYVIVFIFMLVISIMFIRLVSFSSVMLFRLFLGWKCRPSEMDPSHDRPQPGSLLRLT